MKSLLIFSFVLVMVIIAWIYIARHLFKDIQLMNPTGQVNLKGQRSLNKGHSAIIQIPAEGTYMLTIKVFRGKVRLSHNSFNPDGATWLSPPADGQQAYYDLTPGTQQLKFTIRKNYGKLDQILLVNVRFREEAVIHYKLEAIVI